MFFFTKPEELLSSQNLMVSRPKSLKAGSDCMPVVCYHRFLLCHHNDSCHGWWIKGREPVWPLLAQFRNSSYTLDFSPQKKYRVHVAG